MVYDVVMCEPTRMWLLWSANAGNAISVNGERYRVMITDFLKAEMDDINLDNLIATLSRTVFDNSPSHSQE